MTPPVASTTVERVDLPLQSVFTTARSSADTATTLVVRLEDEDGTVGTGAAAPSEYYDERPASVEGVLPDLLDVIDGADPARLQAHEERFREHAPGAAAARAAVSTALHDLVASQAGEPLYRRLGLDPDRAPATSYTVAIDSPAGMARQARRVRQEGYPILKIKLGTDDDRARIDAVREAAPRARVRVDANGAWTASEAIEKTAWLANAGVEFVEQPVPADDVAGLERVADESTVPVAADESCVTAADVPAVADAVDIVVVKLMKCGGIRPAIRQIETANAHGLDVMFGCMIESSASIAPACHLAPLVEYADLDGSLLCAEDPYTAVPIPDGRPELPAVECGTGAEPSEDS